MAQGKRRDCNEAALFWEAKSFIPPSSGVIKQLHILPEVL